MIRSAKIFELYPEYLSWLNLVWKPRGLNHHLAELRKAAEFLAADPSYWSAVIRDDNWRAPLIGGACVVSSKNRSFFGDLCYRFTSGSMVTPQLAVAIGLVHPVEAIAFFRAQVEASVSKKNPRRFVSAQTALTKLGVLKESEIALSGWSPMDQEEAELAQRVVAEHWDFWTFLT